MAFSSLHSARSALALAGLVATAACASDGTYRSDSAHGTWRYDGAAVSASPVYRSRDTWRAPSVSFGGERYPPTPEAGFRSTRDDPLSTFSIDVDTASYVHLRRLLRDGTLPPPEAVRVEEMLNYFRYDYPAPRGPEEPFALTAAVLPNPWDQSTRLLHLGIRGRDLAPEARPPLHLVLLIDVSGSMQGEGRLSLAKEAFSRFLDRLSDRDRIAIVTFNERAQTVLEPTAADRRAKIRRILDSLDAGGSTAGVRGLREAYRLAERDRDEDAVRRVILISDGDFNVGLSDPSGIRAFIAEKRRSGVYLSVLTVGEGNVNDHIAQALAQAGNGQAAHLDGLVEARKVLSRELEANLVPIADDVKIQVEFNPAMVSAYRLIGYGTRRLRDDAFRDDRADAGEVGSGHRVTALYEIVPARPIAGATRPLRYQATWRDDVPAAEAPPASDEFAFLQLRYKQPGGRQGQEIARPVAARDAVESLARAPKDLRFAVAVAGFGELLRGRLDRRDYGYDEVAELARDALGPDPLGLRREFLDLVRQAGRLDDSRW